MKTKTKTADGENEVRPHAADSEGTEKESSRKMLCKIGRVLANVKRSREGIDQAEHELSTAENNYKLAKRRYDKGQSGAGDVKGALESLTRANLSSYQARYDFQVAMIGLEEILSKDLDRLQLEEREGENY